MPENESLAQVFSSEFCKISKNTFFTEHPRWLLLKHITLYLVCSIVYDLCIYGIHVLLFILHVLPKVCFYFFDQHQIIAASPSFQDFSALAYGTKKRFAEIKKPN